MSILLGFFRDFIGVFKALNMDLDLYLRRDPTAKAKWKVFITSTAFHGLVCYRFAHFMHKYKLYPFSYCIYICSKILHSMDIHPAAQLEPGIVIDHGFGIVIGETASVGSGTLIYHGVTLGAKKVVNGKRHPDVGRNVFLGAGSKILGAIFIGDDAVIGANSVVLMDVPPKSVVAGIPAKIKKINCPDSQVYLLESNIQNDFII